MRRQRAKRPSVPEVSSYRGRGLRQAAPWLAVAPALPGLLLILIRPLGMRFSGFLLLALAAVLLAEVYLRRWAGRARAGWWVPAGIPGSAGTGAGAPGDDRGLCDP